jgi:hypothetical protein
MIKRKASRELREKLTKNSSATMSKPKTMVMTKSTTPISLIAKSILFKRKLDTNLASTSASNLETTQNAHKKAKFNTSNISDYIDINSDDEDDLALIAAANAMDKTELTQKQIQTMITVFKQEKIEDAKDFYINAENCIETGLDYNCYIHEK